METERHLLSEEPRIRTATKFVVRTPSNVLETNFTPGDLYIFPQLEEHFRRYLLTVHGGPGVGQMKKLIKNGKTSYCLKYQYIFCLSLQMKWCPCVYFTSQNFTACLKKH